VDFIVSMAGVSATADRILLYNTQYRLRKMKADEHVSQEIMETVERLLKILKEEQNTEAARVKMVKYIDQREREVSAQYREEAAKLGDARKLIENWLDPKFIYALHHDPLRALKEVRMPVLALYGDDDGTIDIGRRLPEIEEALDSTDHEIKIFRDLGHLFMNAKGIPMHKLNTMEETIAPDVLESIYNWIAQL
jgi:uncharacterized protein